MFSHVIPPLLHGIVTTVERTWYMFAVILGAKFGPRIVRGILLRRGGLQ